MKRKRILQTVFSGMVAATMTIGVASCGDLAGLLTSPVGQELLQKLGLTLDLDQLVDGQTKSLAKDDIESIKVNGKEIPASEFEFDENGQITFKDFELSGQGEIEVRVKGQKEPIFIPVDASNAKNGKLRMRAVAEFKDGKPIIKGGPDNDGDGNFDEEFAPFEFRDGEFAFHRKGKDGKEEFVKFKRRGDGGPPKFDFDNPDERFEKGQDGFEEFDAPPPPPHGDHGKPHGGECKFPLADGGGIIVATPDGQHRVLQEGEFKVNPDHSIVVLKEGEPDTGKTVHPPCEKEDCPDGPPNGGPPNGGPPNGGPDGGPNGGPSNGGPDGNNPPPPPPNGDGAAPDGPPPAPGGEAPFTIQEDHTDGGPEHHEGGEHKGGPCPPPGGPNGGPDGPPPPDGGPNGGPDGPPPPDGGPNGGPDGPPPPDGGPNGGPDGPPPPDGGPNGGPDGPPPPDGGPDGPPPPDGGPDGPPPPDGGPDGPPPPDGGPDGPPPPDGGPDGPPPPDGGNPPPPPGGDGGGNPPPPPPPGG